LLHAAGLPEPAAVSAKAVLGVRVYAVASVSIFVDALASTAFACIDAT
jgi:hypothetical protein